MADPHTWLLLGACEACLQRITVANGFHTEAGGYVTREPHQIPDSEPALITMALEGLAPAATLALTRTHRLATVVIVGKVPVGHDDAQLQLHRLISDIERAFENKQADFPTSIQFPAFVEAKPIIPVEGMKWIGAEVRLLSHVPKH